MIRQPTLLRIFLALLSLSLLFSACDIKSKQGSDLSQKMQSTDWKETSRGISYSTLSVDSEDKTKDLIIVQIDPNLYSFQIEENPNKKTAKTIEQIHKETNAALTVNGGFFTEKFKPTGLLISNGKELSSLSNANLVNGIIAITKQGELKFFDTTEFDNDTKINAKEYEFAIQNGPIILDENGNIKTETTSPLTASRTAMGIDKNSNIVLIIVKQSLFNIDNSLTLDQLAHITKDNPELQKLGIHSLVNLDGGSSTGLMIDNKYFPEMEKVQNVVLIKSRTNAT